MGERVLHRFRGVFCTKKPIFVFLDAREMGREQKQGGGGGGEGFTGKRFLRLLSPPPLPFYFALVPISAKNATETLAAQASARVDMQTNLGSFCNR